ncbi:unnamed protein product [Diamesa serratosioi]
MPRGKFVNHKGRNRKFTSPEELEQERKNEEAKKKFRKQKVEEDGSDEESGSEEEGSEEENSEESESDSSEDRKAVGHHALIDIENPNRIPKKAVQKISSLTLNPKAQTSSADGAPPVEQLSRREREEIEKQKNKDAYQKLHAEGKTDQAKADLARLAIIKQQRAEAAAKREADKKEKEAKQQKPAAK